MVTVCVSFKVRGLSEFELECVCVCEVRGGGGVVRWRKRDGEVV